MTWKELIEGVTFIPHGYCLRWDPVILGIELPSDLIIWLGYLFIPLSLVIIARHLRVWVIALAGPRASRFFYEFACFIFLCGATHFMNILTTFHPWFFAAALVKLATAIATAFTCFDLVFVLVQLVIRAKKILELPYVKSALQEMLDEDKEITGRLRAWLETHKIDDKEDQNERE